MRIFCAIRHSKDSRFYYGGLWSDNFYPALRNLGHEIIESQTDLLPTSRFMEIAENFTRGELELRARTTERILEEVAAAQRQGRVDLFLSYFYNAHFDPAGFYELRRSEVPSVNFFCNSIHQFELVSAIAPKVDFSWHTERDARPVYLAVAAKPIWVQMGADPEIYHPMPGHVRIAKACFVGQRYADRDLLAAALINSGVPLDIYGSGWESDINPLVRPPEEGTGTYLGRVYPQPGTTTSYFQAAVEIFRREGIERGLRRLVHQWRYRSARRRLAPMIRSAAKGRADDVAKTFAGYELVLNFSNVWGDGRPGSRLVPHVRLRDFEGPMSRTCYLTGHTEEIQEFYEVGKEIDTYRTLDELVDKAQFYLRNSVGAERLRNAGYLRATKDHNWVKRFSELFSKIGIGDA